jgi:hypothetical protein
MLVGIGYSNCIDHGSDSEMLILLVYYWRINCSFSLHVGKVYLDMTMQLLSVFKQSFYCCIYDYEFTTIALI